jgi:hypothetical protein
MAHGKLIVAPQIGLVARGDSRPGCLVERSSTDFSVPAEPKNSRAWLGRTADGGYPHAGIHAGTRVKIKVKGVGQSLP